MTAAKNTYNTMIKILKKEIHIFLTGLMFYTRIPCSKWVNHSEEYLNKATKYFPLIGWVVGGFTAGVFYFAQYLLPIPVSIILSMICGVLLTGAFHEDGFADVCDGFGGGWTRDKILEIMKDSLIGAYGTLGLVLIILLKFVLLISIKVSLIPFVLIVAHSLSRFTAATFIFTHEYAREDKGSKVKPVAKKNSVSHLIYAGFFGLVPILLLNNQIYFLIILPVLLLEWYLGKYFNKWIGGYTGDCLGATQQLTEIIIYLSFLLLWKFI